MKVLNHVDLGKAFEMFKNSLIEIDGELREKNKDVKDSFESSLNYAHAYGRLSGAAIIHIAYNTDTDYSFLSDALKEAENASNEAPTLYLHDQLNNDSEQGALAD